MSVLWGRAVSAFEDVKRAAADGFDFAQAGGALVASLAEGGAAGAGSGAHGGLPWRVCPVPLPPEVRVTEKGFNLYVWTEHLKEALARLAGWGCRTLAWSDGRARVLPVEGDVSGLKEQVLQFLFVLCEVAAAFDMDVLVEPLGARRTNYLNTMQEVDQLLTRVGKQNLGALISLRELEAMGLSLPELAAGAGRIGHLQLENPLGPASAAGAPGGPGGSGAPGGRTCPRPGDGYDYRAFLQAMGRGGFAGTISLPEDADADGLEYCRGLWEG